MASTPNHRGSRATGLYPVRSKRTLRTPPHQGAYTDPVSRRSGPKKVGQFRVISWARPKTPQRNARPGRPSRPRALHLGTHAAVRCVHRPTPFLPCQRVRDDPGKGRDFRPPRASRLSGPPASPRGAQKRGGCSGAPGQTYPASCAAIRGENIGRFLRDFIAISAATTEKCASPPRKASSRGGIWHGTSCERSTSGADAFGRARRGRTTHVLRRAAGDRPRKHVDAPSTWSAAPRTRRHLGALSARDAYAAAARCSRTNCVR